MEAAAGGSGSCSGNEMEEDDTRDSIGNERAEDGQCPPGQEDDEIMITDALLVTGKKHYSLAKFEHFHRVPQNSWRRSTCR